MQSLDIVSNMQFVVWQKKPDVKTPFIQELQLAGAKQPKTFVIITGIQNFSIAV